MAKRLSEFMVYKDMARWHFERLVAIHAIPKDAIVKELNKKKVRVFYERRRRKS